MAAKVFGDAINRFVPGWGCLEAALGPELRFYANRGVSNHSLAIKAIVKGILQNGGQFVPIVQPEIAEFISSRICHLQAGDRTQCIEKFVEEKFRVIESLPDEPDVFSVVSDSLVESTKDSRYIIVVNSDRTFQDLKTKVIQEIFRIVVSPGSRKEVEGFRGAMSLIAAESVCHVNPGFSLAFFFAAPIGDCMGFGITLVTDKIFIRHRFKELAETYESKTR